MAASVATPAAAPVHGTLTCAGARSVIKRGPLCAAAGRIRLARRPFQHRNMADAGAASPALLDAIFVDLHTLQSRLAAARENPAQFMYASIVDAYAHVHGVAAGVCEASDHMAGNGGLAAQQCRAAARAACAAGCAPSPDASSAATLGALSAWCAAAANAAEACDAAAHMRERLCVEFPGLPLAALPQPPRMWYVPAPDDGAVLGTWHGAT